MFRLTFSRDSLEFARAMTACAEYISGSFGDELLDEALKIFEAKHYTRGLVEVYSYRGANERKNSDSSKLLLLTDLSGS